MYIYLFCVDLILYRTYLIYELANFSATHGHISHFSHLTVSEMLVKLLLRLLLLLLDDT